MRLCLALVVFFINIICWLTNINIVFFRLPFILSVAATCFTAADAAAAVSLNENHNDFGVFFLSSVSVLVLVLAPFVAEH